MSSTLQKRIASALVMVAITAFALYLGRTGFLVLIAAVTTAMIAEWWRMATSLKTGTQAWPGTPAFYGALILTFSGFMASVLLAWPLFICLMAIALIIAALNFKSVEKKWMLAGPFYLLIAAACAFRLYDTFGAWSLVWLLLLVAAADTGAFFVGRQVGGIKLAPSISPNKTVSGAVGGLLLANIACFWFMFGLSAEFGSLLLVAPFLSLFAALCIAIASQAGDLLESFAKRQHDIKDSSNLIPGHGGFLDRLDGVLLAAPVALFFLVNVLG